MSTTLETARLLVSAPAHYATRLARTAEEIRAAQALRFEVFNLELNEGLAASHATGLDADPFDTWCDHLFLFDDDKQRVMGTYRAISGARAREYGGFYAADEFDLAPLAPIARREEAWSSGDRDTFVDADAAFHLAIVAASHNEVLAELYADLGQVIRDSLRDHFSTELPPGEYMDHARLVEAVRAGVADTAAAEAASHTSGCRFGLRA